MTAKDIPGQAFIPGCEPGGEQPRRRSMHIAKRQAEALGALQAAGDEGATPSELESYHGIDGARGLCHQLWLKRAVERKSDQDHHNQYRYWPAGPQGVGV